MKILVTAVIDVPDINAEGVDRARLDRTIRPRLTWDGCTIDVLTVEAFDPAPRPDYAATEVGRLRAASEDRSET